MKVTVDTKYLYSTGDPDLVWARQASDKIERWFVTILKYLLFQIVVFMIIGVAYTAGKLHRPLNYSYIFVPASHDSLLAWSQFHSFSEIPPDSVIAMLKSAKSKGKKR